MEPFCCYICTFCVDGEYIKGGVTVDVTGCVRNTTGPALIQSLLVGRITIALIAPRNALIIPISTNPSKYLEGTI